jgi:thiol-disulfide isomerase/thioredoxin
VSSADAADVGAIDGGRRCLLASLALIPWRASCGEEKPRRAGPVPGTPFRPPVVTALDGSSYQWPAGRPMLVNFWATWCRPCRAEMPSLDRLYRQAMARGLEVLAVSVDSDVQLVREFVLQTGVSFPVLLDRSGEATRDALAISAFPTTVLVERSGAVAGVVVGEREWDAGPARAAAEALLA